ncbi:MAG: type II toxin-antitoxin system HicB family antitoxin [Candidatus Nanoarchaeia archaeon]
MENKLSCGVSVHEEELSDGKKVFVVECVELGVSDFGETLDKALDNLKKGITLLLEEAPEKKELLEKEEPLMVTRLFL